MMTAKTYSTRPRSRSVVVRLGESLEFWGFAFYWWPKPQEEVIFKTNADDDFAWFCMMFPVGVLFYWQPVGDDGRYVFWIFRLVSYGKWLCALMTQMLNAITTYLNIGQFKQAVSIRYLPCQCWRLTRSTYSDGGDSPDGISSVPLERRLRSWPRGLNKDWPRWLNLVDQF